MRAIATTFARFCGLAVLMYSGIALLGNLAGASAGATFDPAWILLPVLGIFAAGLAGSIVYLLSFDGPTRWRTRGRRAVGWIGMMIAALLPTSLWILIVPVSILGMAGLFLPVTPPPEDGRQMLSSG